MTDDAIDQVLRNRREDRLAEAKKRWNHGRGEGRRGRDSEGVTETD